MLSQFGEVQDEKINSNLLIFNSLPKLTFRSNQ